MSGGAAKRAKRGEKEQLSKSGQAVLNAMVAGDGKALHEAMYLLPEGLPNVASSAQDVKKSKNESLKAGNRVAAPALAQVGEKRKVSDKPLMTEMFCQNPSLSPLHEACHATMQRVKRSTIVEPKDDLAAAHLKLHNKVLHEELKLRENAIRRDQARRKQDIQKQMDQLKSEMTFFEENICDLKQKVSIESKKTSSDESAKGPDRVQCAQS